MKTVLLSVSLILCSAFGMLAQDATTSSPKFQFEEEVVDYGTIEYGANGDREFKFTNIGTAPLIISKVKGSCGCTTPSWSKEPIMPGASGTIKIHYDTKRPGSFTKTVTLTSNAETPIKVLTIKGVVGAQPDEDEDEGEDEDEDEQ